MEEIIREVKEGDEKDSGIEESGLASTVEQRQVMEAVKEGLLQIHSLAPNTKQHGIFQIMGENCNGLNNRIGGNRKIAKALDIKEELDLDCLLYCEHHINFKHKENKNNLKQMFQQELACTAVAAHNVHKGKMAGRVQEGGTGSICFGESTCYVRKTGQDSEGLGHWCWILFSGEHGHKT